MDNPRKCAVYFEADLTPEAIEQRIAAIRLLQGVRLVTTDQTSVKVPRREEEVIYDTSPDTTAQRHTIDRALLWGVEQGKINANQLAKLDAQQLIDLAFGFLEIMPEAEKRKLGDEISHFMK